MRLARERFAIVFQQYNLFQNMTALKNVTLAPIKIQGRPKKEVEAEAVALLEKVGLGGKLKAYPDELSGGQQQRVAIARSLALKPEILLSRARSPRLSIQSLLMRFSILSAYWQKEGRTMIIVSHEMGFVLSKLSSKIAFMDAGRIIEVGDPKKVLRNPDSDRAREFMSKILRH